MEKKTLLLKILKQITITLGYLYFAGMFGYAVYFNYLHIRSNGFRKWITSGENIEASRSIIWPYYVFDKNLMQELHFINTIHYSVKAAEFYEQQESSNTGISLKKLINYRDLIRLALEEAKLVDTKRLNTMYPNFGDHFKDEYLKSLQMAVEFFDNDNVNSDKVLDEQANILNKRWGNWYNSNIANIKAGNKIEI